MSSSEFTPVAVIPGIYAKAPVGNGYVKIAGSKTSFTRPYREQFPEFDRFCEAFRANDGDKLLPSFVFMRTNPDALRESGSALIAFRNIITLSITMTAAKTQMTHGTPGHFGFQFSDNGDFFPWMLGKNLKNVYAINSAFLGFQDTGDFIGHAAPQIFPKEIDDLSGDHLLRAELLTIWTEHFVVSPRPSLLFRSFEMAYQASRLPPAYLHSDVDHGRLIALWVSAFETLFHPGPGGKSGFGVVQTALLDYRPNSEAFSRKDWTFNYGGKLKNCTLHEWLYKQLYDARNAYLHGNEVNTATLKLKGLNTGLLYLAPILYRLGIEVFLTSHRPKKIIKGEADFDRTLTETWAELEHEMNLQEYEKALLGAWCD